jgi:hypothetical protein
MDFNSIKGKTLVAVTGCYKDSDEIRFTTSDGDSFGHDADRRCEFFTAHRSEQQATANANILSDANGFSAEIFLDDGTPFTTSIPWNGYFEILSYVRAESFVVGAGVPHTFTPKFKR